jgi:hypothetical protein
MSNNVKAFTRVIAPLGSGPDENFHVNQSSPTWVLTFVRWQFRDTLRTPTDSPDQVRPPLVIENDCISVTTTMNKGTLTPSMTAVLKMTDVNYETEIAPGDFVFVNILNWERDSRRVADQARQNQPINGINDGFKGFFKVQSVRRSVTVDPESGTKNVLFNITGFAFTEFNNTIYFNPNLVNQKSLANQALFISDVGAFWSANVTRSSKPPIQDVIAFLIMNFIGAGASSKSRKVGGQTISPNVHFLVPTLVGRLLGVVDPDIGQTNNENKYKTTQAVKDVYIYLFGIQQYASGTATTNLSAGMNPSNLKPQQEYPGFYYTNQLCGGLSLLKPEFWNQVKLWSIMNQYTNTPLNEMYTCFRIAPAVNRVMPTLVFRQIPFTNTDFVSQTMGTQDAQANSIPVTTFLTLPRWKITSDLIDELDIGRDEAARINFVQYYAKSNFNDKGIEVSGETAKVNYMFDAEDIKRNGLRPYIAQNQFDDSPDNLTFSAPIWARIVGDALVGGQLKLNGTMACIGIADPITVGDNLEFDGTVYHIEQVTHTATINIITGSKSFRTVLSLSSGINIQGSAKGMTYSEMTYSDAYKLRENDAKYNQVLPGVSESQDVVYRPKSVDQPHSGGAPFPQPFINTQNKNKKNEDND